MENLHISTFGLSWDHHQSLEEANMSLCYRYSTVKVPDFIGNIYFCESGNPEETAVPGKVYITDTLWDIRGCNEAEASCCRENKDEYIYAVLPSSTTDDIELRVCSDEATSDEDFVLGNIGIAIY